MSKWGKCEEARREIFYDIHSGLCMAKKISPHPTTIPGAVRRNDIVYIHSNRKITCGTGPLYNLFFAN